VPTLTSKVSCNQRVFIAVNPGRIPLHMQSTCGKCVYILLCATYVASISQMHTVVLLLGKCKSINVNTRGPLSTLGGGPANIHLQGLQKTQTGSTIYINNFFHLFSAAAMLQHLSDVSEPTWDTAGNAGKAEVWDRFDTAFQH